MVEKKLEEQETTRPSHWPHWLGERFSWASLIVFAVSEFVGGTLCIAAAEAFVHRDWVAVGLGWGPGLPLVIFGLAFPFRGHLMGPETRERIQRQAIGWSPVVILAAFGYVVGPYIYHHAIPEPPPVVQPARPITEAEWLSGRRAAEKFVPADLASDAQKAADNLTQQLRDGLLIARGIPHYGHAGDPAINIPTGEWQMLRVTGTGFDSAAATNGPQHSYDALEIHEGAVSPEQRYKIQSYLADARQERDQAKQQLIAKTQEITDLTNELTDANSKLADKDKQLEQAKSLTFPSFSYSQSPLTLNPLSVPDQSVKAENLIGFAQLVLDVRGDLTVSSKENVDKIDIERKTSGPRTLFDLQAQFPSDTGPYEIRLAEPSGLSLLANTSFSYVIESTDKNSIKFTMEHSGGGVFATTDYVTVQFYKKEQ